MLVLSVLDSSLAVVLLSGQVASTRTWDKEDHRRGWEVPGGFSNNQFRQDVQRGISGTGRLDSSESFNLAVLAAGKREEEYSARRPRFETVCAANICVICSPSPLLI